MIEKDELDIKERLKNKISWKSLLRNLVGIILVILSFIILSIGRTNPDIQGQTYFLGIILMCIATSLIIEESKEKKIVKQTLTSLECPNCGAKIVRDYENGDYVFNKSGKCGKCGSDLIITKIHSVKLKLK
ncbi:MAG: TFIIB-type zinc ribbon-containing protein [Promethearchaeota archaeon]